MAKLQQFNIGDRVRSPTKEYKVGLIEHTFLNGIMYGPGGLSRHLDKESDLELSEPNDQLVQQNIERMKVEYEAKYHPQKYLSRLDPDLDVDEAVKYFGPARLLNEIGVFDAIDHWGPEEIKKHL